ncbi:hypothetical protein PQX77_003970 [Marasmius sp. AFHP31]|nr:hypothetical protein PQX77_003970 [Marasmius sp. AFHP31]
MYTLNLTVDDSSPLIYYEGNWSQKVPDNEETAPKYHDKTFMVTYERNASATFTFNGTYFAVAGGRAHVYGNFTVTIDNKDVHELSSYAMSGEEKYQQTLFETNLAQGYHSVRLTSTDNNGYGFDIDSITWRTNVSSGKYEPQTPPMAIFQDTQKEAVKYLPAEAWSTSPERAFEFKDGTGHSTSQMNASIILEFEGKVKLCLICPSNTQSYTVQVDEGRVQTFSAQRPQRVPGQMLFHAEDLGPGNHTVVMTNRDTRAGIRRFRGSPRQEVVNGMLEFDFATVWDSPEPVRSSTSITPTETKSSPSPNPNLERSGLSPGAIAGITISCIVFVTLFAALWFLLKRNKTLCKRLQAAYMIPSPFDTLEPALNTTNQADKTSLVNQDQSKTDVTRPLLLNLDGNNNSHHILPINASGVLHNRESALTKIENSTGYPFTGFGRDRSSSKGSRSELTSSSSLSSRENPYPDSAYPARNDGAPVRSGTIDTVSTLVAENGSETEHNEPLLKVITKRPLMGPRPSGRVPPTPAPTSATASSRSSRRISFARRPYRRSSSPSSARLLPERGESGDDENLYEDEGADFYASQVPFVTGTPLSPSYSVAYTQSEINTPVRGRYDSLMSSSLGVVDEDRERESAEAAQNRLLDLQRARSHRASIHTESDGTGDEDGLDTRDSNTVELPIWTERLPVESPPPGYTSNRVSFDALARADVPRNRTATPTGH